MPQSQFPPDFVWGTATASYQIEGAVHEDGRGVSIWDTFSHTPGKTFNGDTGDVACDHYHRWRDDIQLMQRLGLQAYRFSIAWPRVLPQGTGAVNAKGLDFYDQLVDGLLAANITPYVTLYHWDLPQPLQDKGGWVERDTVDAFVAFADVVARRLGDRVKYWITHNEPWVVAFLGNLMGEHAPGLTDAVAAIQVSHHLLVSHGRAVPVIRAASPGAQVGITLNPTSVYPASDAPEDAVAAHRFDGFINRWFFDPLAGRGYPADMLQGYGLAAPQIQANDLAEIATPLDFVGLNYYAPQYIRATSDNILGFAPLEPQELAQRGFEMTEMQWPVEPRGLYDLLVRVHRDYGWPTLYITENGMAAPDQLVDGRVDDPRRIAYLRSHFQACLDAIAQGVPLRGYFQWSLMDNFEWAHGYSKRFGIVYVDYETQARIPKASADWYRQVITTNALDS